MNTTTEKSIFKTSLNDKECHDLRHRKEVFRHGEDGSKNICIFVHPNDFPITEKSKIKPVDNFGIRESKGGAYMIKVSLSELLDPITQRIIGNFIDPDDHSEYSKFEIDLNLDD